MSLYDANKLRELREELKRLEERAAFIRQQIQIMEYQKPRTYYTSDDYDWFSVMFGEDKDA